MTLETNDTASATLGIYLTGPHHRLVGGPDNDLLVAGDGSGPVEANGQGGSDSMFGGPGDDLLFGQDGDDFIVGNGGDDVLAGGSGADSIMGSDGDDHLFGGSGADVLSGDDGADLIFGGGDNDFIEGDADNDTLFGDAGNDWIYGGHGSDMIVGGAGHDQLDGGPGDDVFVFRSGDGRDIIAAPNDAGGYVSCDRDEVRFIGVGRHELTGVGWQMEEPDRRDLVVRYGDADELIIQGEVGSSHLSIYQFRFSGNDVLPTMDLLQLYAAGSMTPGVENNEIDNSLSQALERFRKMAASDTTESEAMPPRTALPGAVALPVLPPTEPAAIG